MPSAVWKGHLTFGLVSFPIEIVAAARRKTISFELLHRTDHSKIKQVSFCRAEDRPLERDEMVKGFAIEKDKYVIIEPEEITKIAPPTAKAMEILEFVVADEIDPIFFDASYYLRPSEGGERPYALLFQAMEQSKYSAIAKLTMHNREHTVVIRAGKRGMRLHTMFYADEIREADEFRTDITDISAKELALAKTLIESLTDSFEAKKYRDTYRERLEQMIEAKSHGKKMSVATAPKVGTVVNIMDALKESIEKAAKPAAKKVAAARKGPKTVVARPTKKTAAGGEK